MRLTFPIGFAQAVIRATRGPMSIGRRFNTHRAAPRPSQLVVGAMMLGITLSPASSRVWKATPIQIAADYSLINHSKSSTETVNINWWAAPTLSPGAITGLLEKYVVISIVHFHVNPGATLAFDDIKTLEANDGSGKPLAPVSRNELPSVFISFLSTLEAGSRQSLGRLGDGTKFFIFDAGAVRACEDGRLSIPFAGETYTWDTPFPGCTVHGSPTEPKPAPTVAIQTDRAAPAAPLSAPTALAQKAVLYEEDTSNPMGSRYVGSAVWHNVQLPPAPGQSPDPAITADVEIPDQRIGVQVSLQRNVDKELPASHTIEIRFKLPVDFRHGGISNIPGVLMKELEAARGMPLVSRAVKTDANFFIVGLSSVDADMQRNLRLLKERGWFDIPVVYSDGKRAILAIEKGPPGERAFSDAFAAWANAPVTSSAQTNR